MSAQRGRRCGRQDAVGARGRGLTGYDFLTDRKERIDAGTIGDATAGGGHGGGDDGLMDAFVTAVATGDSGAILSGPDESLETHLAMFAAERSRHTSTVQAVAPM